MRGFSNQVEIILIVLIWVASIFCVNWILAIQASNEKEPITFDSETEELSNRISDVIAQMDQLGANDE